MNSLIDSLNVWGARFLDFAGPMLWQSSLLMAVVFAADFLLRRKIRAAVRYSLWFVVFVKLVVPPTLALPTGAAWWLRGRPEPVAVAKHARTLTVHYSDAADDYVPPATEPVFIAPPAPKLSRAGWALVLAVGVSGFLAAWLMLRWRQVARCVRRTTAANAEISEMLTQARRQAGLRKNVTLRVTSAAMSPAVCGLFRPVILLPQSLLDKLTANQLRAVLLHELIHLRRRDVWVNCAQTLLQVFYWWHPLLWVANARVRRVREEAVDDAVMCALQAEAEIYAPTLLEVAKLAFSRPLASLGLVGILESRNALRHRIERLLNFATPRRAGVSVVSVICLAAFTALAVPMGEPPARSLQTANISDGSDLGSEKLIPYHAKVNPEVFLRNIKARAGETMHTTNDDWHDILVSIMDGVGVDCTGPRAFALDTAKGELTSRNSPEVLNLVDEVVKELNLAGGERILNPQRGLMEALIEAQFYEVRPEDVAKLGLSGQSLHRDADLTPWWGLSSTEFVGAQQHLKELGIKPMMSPRIQTYNGVMASLFVGDGTNNVRLECVPYVRDGVVKLSTLARTTGIYAPDGKGWPDVAGHTNCAIFSRLNIPDGDGAALVAEPVGATKQLLILLKTKILDPAAQANAAGTGAGTGLRKAPDAASLLADGKLLFQQGKMDEAEAKLQRVLAMEPKSQAALDHLSLIKQLKFRKLWDEDTKGGAQNVPGPDGPPVNKDSEEARQKIFLKLNEITFDRISYPNVSLADVLPDLKARTKERDPDGKGMRFILPLSLVRGGTNFTTTHLPSGFPPGLDSTSIIINVAEMKNASLLDVLEAIVKSANYPLIYSIAPGGVSLSLVTPQVANGNVHTNTKRQELSQKLTVITFDKISYTNLPLVEVIRNLSEQTTRRDPDQEGINFVLNRTQPGINQPQSRTDFDPTTGAPISQAPPDFDLTSVKINAELKNVRLADVLQAIVKGADHPIKYSLLDYGVEFSFRGSNGFTAHTRTFRVDMKKFFEKYPVVATPYGTNADDPTAIQITVIKFFNEVGVNLAPPKSVFFNDRQGTFTVRATAEDLEHIQSALDSGKLLLPLPPTIADAPELHTRTFKVDTNTLYAGLKNADSGPAALGTRRYVAGSYSTTELQMAVMNFLEANGVNLTPPKSVFYSDGKGLLTVRATDEELVRIETALNRLNAASAQDSGKVTAPPAPVVADAAGLRTRMYKVDVNTFFMGLAKQGLIPPVTNATISTAPSGQRTIRSVMSDSDASAFRANVQNGLLTYFRNKGVDLQAPKSVFFNDRESALTVQATEGDLKLVEAAISVLNTAPPEVTIKARFVETDKQFLKMLSTNGIAVPVHGAQNWVLTEEQFKPILKALEKRDHGDLLNEGEVTTLSGRQANFQVVDVTTVVFASPNTTPPYENKTEPFGTTLDVLAEVAADNRTIQLHATPNQTEFLGYQDVKTGKLHKTFDSTMTTALPVSRSRQTKMDTIVSDGDTLVLGDFGDLWATEKPDGTVDWKPFDNKSDKQLVVFVTVTIIDASGNRVHVNDASARPKVVPATTVSYETK